MLLHLKPGLVDMEAAKEIDPPLEGLGAQDGVHRWRPIADFTESGVIGAPNAASAEKGAKLLAAAASSLAEAIGGDALWPSR